MLAPGCAAGKILAQRTQVRNNQVERVCWLAIVLCHLLQDEAIRCPMRAKTAYSVLLIQVIWQRIDVRSWRHRLMERCIVDTNLHARKHASSFAMLL